MTEFIRRIHSTSTAAAFVVTGGGASALSQLLGVPGASRTVLEAVVPYSPQSLKNYLGALPEQFCSEPTARSMAVAAYLRAQQLRGSEEIPVVGIAATCSLASDRPKRGEHRVHLAYQSTEQTVSWSLTLEKEARSRSKEEEIAAQLVLNLTARSFGLDEEFPIEFLSGDKIGCTEHEAPVEWRELLTGKHECVLPKGVHHAAQVKAILPGAFNPLHDGHRGMKEVAERLLGERVFYELSIKNVDKPPLDYIEIGRRTAQFDDGVLLSQCPTFADKAQLIPRVVFAVGIDTLVRIGQTKYYADAAARDAALRSIAEHGCTFLVFGRSIDGRFESLEDVEIHPILQPICRAVPKEEFRADISSSELRRSGSSSSSS